MDVCFKFPEMGMRKLIYRGDRLWGTEDIHFGERICFRKTGRNSGIAFSLTGDVMPFCYKYGKYIF